MDRWYRPDEADDPYAGYGAYGTTYDDEYAEAAYGAGDRGRRPRSGRERRARSRFAPSAVVLSLAVLGAGGVIGYGLLVDRSGLQMPLVAVGLAVLGMALVGLALTGAGAAVSAGREGRGGRSLFLSLVGGLLAVAAAGSLGAAVILVLIWGST